MADSHAWGIMMRRRLFTRASMKASAAKSISKPNAKSTSKERGSASAARNAEVKLKSQADPKNQEDSSGIQNAEDVAPEKLEEVCHFILFFWDNFFLWKNFSYSEERTMTELNSPLRRRKTREFFVWASS